MPDSPTYLSFSVGNRRYSISSDYLDEILLLPEVTLLATASTDIIGAINLRGEILPVIDPQLSLGHPETMPYQLSHSLVVLRQGQLRVGLIVSQIDGLESFGPGDIDTTTPALQSRRDRAKRQGMLAGQIRPQGDLSDLDRALSPIEQARWLIHPLEQWLQYVDVQPLMAIGTMVGGASLDSFASSSALVENAVFCPAATPDERAIFQQRSQNLYQAAVSDRPSDVLTLAIVTIQNRYFGIDVLAVQEFAALRSWTPVPCCPSHVVGNMNLRGEILTLIDIYPAIASELTPIPAVNPTPNSGASAATISDNLEASTAMVVDVEDCLVGIVIDAVAETMFALPQQDLIPNADHANHQTAQQYLTGQLSYRDQPVNIVDLSALFSKNNLVVDEVVA